MQMISYVLGITDVKGIDSVWRYHNYATASNNVRMVMMSSSVVTIVLRLYNELLYFVHLALEQAFTVKYLIGTW